MYQPGVFMIYIYIYFIYIPTWCFYDIYIFYMYQPGVFMIYIYFIYIPTWCFYDIYIFYMYQPGVFMIYIYFICTNLVSPDFTVLYFSQKQPPRKMKSRLVIIDCAGYIFRQLFLQRLRC